MTLQDLGITDVIVESDNYTIHLFDRDTLRIETGDQDIFLSVEDVETAVDEAKTASYSTLTELDRRVIGRILAQKNGRYAALAKQFREDAHSGDYVEAIRAIEREEDTELTSRKIMNRLDQIVDRTIQALEQHVETAGWPTNLKN